MTFSRSQLTMCVRGVFYFAAAAVLAAALAPVSGPSGSGVDKVQHLAAFYGLTLLALAAHPRSSWILLAAGLAAFGGLIEALQGLALFARDRDFADWLADVLGIVIAVLPLLPGRWRAAVRMAESDRQPHEAPH